MDGRAATKRTGSYDFAIATLIAQLTEVDDYHENKKSRHCRLGLLAVVCASKSFDRRFVRRSRRIHFLSLKGQKNEPDKC
jgi:hypothetical protein